MSAFVILASRPAIAGPLAHHGAAGSALPRIWSYESESFLEQAAAANPILARKRQSVSGIPPRSLPATAGQALTRAGKLLLLMYGLEIRCAGITHIKEHQP
jgi:hypothetical protein